MFTIKLEGFKEAQEVLKNAGRQAPYVTANALNDLAFMIRTKEIETMGRVFKNPRPETLRNIRVRKATKSNLTTTIMFNQIWDWDEYMVTQIEGGPRPMKRSEKAFGHYYVPGPGAILDQYGNVSGTQIQQIMSYLGRFKERGFKMNRTVGRKAALGKGMKDYFIIESAGKGLKPGVYLRVDNSQGQMLYAKALASKKRGTKKADVRSQMRGRLERGIVPVLLFVNKAPTYRARFPFYEVANKVVSEQGQSVFATRLEQAIKGTR